MIPENLAAQDKMKDGAYLAKYRRTPSSRGLRRTDIASATRMESRMDRGAA